MYQAIISRVRTRPHSNADKLQLADVCGTTVVVGLDTRDGDLGVYFPPDGLLSHEFLVKNNLYNKSARTVLGLGDGPTGFFDTNRRIRAQKFRGEKSDGIWLPLTCLDYIFGGLGFYAVTEGQMFDAINGHLVCEKWTTRKGSPTQGSRSVKKGELVGFPKHVDTEQWFYHDRNVPAGSLLTITEKLHGTSHRVGLVKDNDRKWWQFWKPSYVIVHGSRNVVLTEHTGRTSFYGSDDFRYKATEELVKNLRKGEVVYGEIVGDIDANTPIMPGHEIPKEFKEFGSTVNWSYGLPRGHAKFYVYRITQFNDDGRGTELSYAQIVGRCADLNVSVVPWLATYIHEPATTNVAVKLLTGDPAIPSTMGNGIREGVIVRVDTPNGLTYFYKNKSFLFKVLEGIVKMDTTYADVEENA